MQLQFKTQAFQTDAADAICKIFEGQPYQTRTYRIDPGIDRKVEPQQYMDYHVQAEKEEKEKNLTGYENAPIQLTDNQILANLQAVQLAHNLRPSEKLAVNAPTSGKAGKKKGKAATRELFAVEPEVADAKPAPATPKPKELKYNFTVEMETGVGKTYAYIKTMHELYRRYGWRKFIVIVPSVAIREGVFKSFQILKDHFQGIYAGNNGDDRPAAKINPCFIYNSYKLEEIQSFASSADISVMIINSQAFNTREKARGVSLRIYEKLDDFGSRRPIDILAATNPILIIDEPQSVEGDKTREMLGCFNPLMTLRYSATPKEEYDLVYRLDAKDAYDMKLVKKIAVKGVSESNVAPNGAYLYLESINLSEAAPTATLEFFAKNAKKPRRKILRKGDDLYAYSDEFEAYKESYVIDSIDGREGVVSFLNGLRVRVGEVVGKTNEEQLRRIQIRETIESHLEKERELFRAVPGTREGVKVLSLFFIDEVAKYRVYENGEAQNGVYAKIFEEEYQAAVARFQPTLGEEAYVDYLLSIDVAKTHEGYFSIDKKTGQMIDSKSPKGKRAEETGSDDVGAYDLIMKDKERLLDLDPQRSPVRFIFSHSALREGWDNPNVFQICTLKQSASETRKRQEVGRGMRLCVDQSGKRLDEEVLKNDVHNVNTLTVVASESYETYVAALQSEIADAVSYRPRLVTAKLFENKILRSDQDPMRTTTISEVLAEDIVADLKEKGYIDNKRKLTDAFFSAVHSNTFQCGAVEKEYAKCVAEILNSVFTAPKIDNAKAPKVTIKRLDEQMKRKEFQELWKKINAKTYYLAKFDSSEVVTQAIKLLNSDQFEVPKTVLRVSSGVMEKIESKEALAAGEAFKKSESKIVAVRSPSAAEGGVKYDLVGKLAESTDLTRHEIVGILTGMDDDKFELFQWNPEEFIQKASQLINQAKLSIFIEGLSLKPGSIEYKTMGVDYDETEIFTASFLKATPEDRVLPVRKHLYDHVLCDSDVEMKFAGDLEEHAEVAVYVKLPGRFYIPTPYGDYNPDWAIAFDEDSDENAVKRVYFVAETKGSTASVDLRPIETGKTACAKAHFEELMKDVAEDRRKVKYGVVSTYAELMTLVGGGKLSDAQPSSLIQ